MPVSARKPSATTSSTSSSPGISASLADEASQIMYKAATTFAPPPVLAIQEALTPVLNSKVTQLIHPDELGTASPCQPKLKTYPFTKFGDKNRSFGGALWYSKFPWLEYSIKQDKYLCYPCRKYTHCHDLPSDSVFSVNGFSNWKIGLEKGKGLLRHNLSQSHMVAMEKWKEHTIRAAKGTEIQQLLSPLQIEKNRYYLQCIFDVCQFLVVNELSFRGSTENGESIFSTGKFLSPLSYTIKKDEKLKEIVKSIPDYAKYTSPEIQNMIIEDMTSIVRNKIVHMVKSSDCNMFTLKCDGIRDKNNIKNVSVVVRFAF